MMKYLPYLYMDTKLVASQVGPAAGKALFKRHPCKVATNLNVGRLGAASLPTFH